MHKTHPQKVDFPEPFLPGVPGDTARQQERAQLFLAASAIHLAPQAKLKSVKGLPGLERKETTHLLYSTQSSAHNLIFGTELENILWDI